MSKDTKGHFAPSHKKNLDNLKLLFSDPEIKEIVAEARKFLDVLPGGFSDTKDIEQWWGEMHKRSNELLASKTLRGHIKKIKEDIQGKLVSESMAKEQAKLLYQQLPENYLSKTVADILNSRDLPNNYEDSIRTYIMSGIIIAPPFPFSIVSNYVDEPLLDPSKSVSVEIYSELTEDDLTSLNRMKSIFVKKLPQSPKPIKDIDRKIKIEEVRQTKKVFDPVDQTLYTRTAKDIAEAVDEELNSKKHTTVNQVNDAPRELKALREKRFKKKLGR